MEPLLLHSVHQAQGGRFGALVEREVVLGYATDARPEAQRVMDVSFRDLLRVTGPDRLSFLQGMLTQDLLGLAEGRAAPAALCTAKGALVADMEVVRQGAAVWLDLEPGLGAVTKATLERFLISEDAELADARGEWAALELWGARAPPGFGWSARLQWGGAEGERWYVPRAQLEQAWRAALSNGATPAGFEAREVLRVAASRPRFGQDMEAGTLPLEANLSDAINYEKGCYVGQEVIARATYRGHLHWSLVGVSFDGAVPVGAELSAEGKAVGRVTSSIRSAEGGHLGLARLKSEWARKGTTLSAGAFKATVR